MKRKKSKRKRNKGKNKEWKNTNLKKRTRKKCEEREEKAKRKETKKIRRGKKTKIKGKKHKNKFSSDLRFLFRLSGQYDSTDINKEQWLQTICLFENICKFIDWLVDFNSMSTRLGLFYA